MKPMLVTGAILFVSTLLLGCDSRFVEKSPDQIDTKGPTLEERIQYKLKIDAQIDAVEEAADRIHRILNLIQKVQNPDSNFDVYTPIDFLIDLNLELRKKIPSDSSEGLVRQAKVFLPLPHLSRECQSIDSLLQSSNIYLETDEEPIGERLTYSFSTCSSGGEFVPAVEASWIDSKLEIRLIRENIHALFGDLVIESLTTDSLCEISQDDDGIIQTMDCEHFELKLSQSESAFVKHFSFDNLSQIRFVGDFDIYENGRKKSAATLRVFDNGDVDLDLDKIDPEESK